MRCRHCAAEIPEDSDFCSRCGKAVREGSDPSAGDATWEYCQIERRGFSRWDRGGLNQRIWFSAEALGPQGAYSAGESQRLHYNRLQAVVERVRGDEETILSSMVQRLTNEGWEPLNERGQEWYQLRLRRRVS